MPVKPVKKIPFEFVLEELFQLDPMVRPMFGCHAVYVGEKIVMILRDKEGVHEESNGIWIATAAEHHASLKKDFPTATTVEILSMPGRETPWRMIHRDDENFEEYALKLCGLIRKKDPRIGKIPKAKKKKS